MTLDALDSLPRLDLGPLKGRRTWPFWPRKGSLQSNTCQRPAKFKRQTEKWTKTHAQHTWVSRSAPTHSQTDRATRSYRRFPACLEVKTLSRCRRLLFQGTIFFLLWLAMSTRCPLSKVGLSLLVNKSEHSKIGRLIQLERARCAVELKKKLIMFV